MGMFDLGVRDWLLMALMALPVVATLLPLIPAAHWSVRVFDFPRLQIAALSVLCMVLNPLFKQSDSPLFLAMELLNLGCVLYQFKEIHAYTWLAKKQVLDYQGADDDRRISILNSNVLTPNRHAEKLIALVKHYQPDLLLTLESDQWWQDQLSILECDYPYTVKIPLDNLYGMHLYSRLPLNHAQILYRVREDIPSIETEVQLRSGEWIKVFCLHPMPPSPTEAETATERDGELLIVGHQIEHSNETCLVFGDLNDVGWSKTSRLFQKISGLIDPRVGRGLFSTFHAHYPFLRWPLDHIFVSNDFLVRRLRRLPNIGSDHFPVFAEFQYHPAAEAIQPEPEASAEDKARAHEKIEEAEPIHQQAQVKYTENRKG